MPDEREPCFLERLAYETADPSIMEMLSMSEDVAVRMNLAGNGNLPLELLERLSRDRSENVRYMVASNRRTPKEICDRLVHDPAWHVVNAAFDKADKDRRLLRKLSRHGSRFVRATVAAYRGTPVSVLEGMRDDGDPHVRRIIMDRLKSHDDYIRRKMRRGRP